MSLYRKYRPQTFEDVVGQEHVARTLRNALTADPPRVAHAYLFTGPRGIGKTTNARLLAKCLNCETGPTPIPCNKCDFCVRVTNNQPTMDLIEIDAASNTGVDNIRETIIDKVGTSPAEGRYRVYIIDEVHMLSNNAFNALLKTLEEPPAHAIFILATTEYHKVPATITSRCQRFDFRRVTPPDIAKRLQYVAGCEGMTLNDDAAKLIARHAEGALRDALTLLEQVSAFSNQEITAADVRMVLGGVPQELIDALVDNMATGDTHAVLETLERAVDEGASFSQLGRDLTSYLRDLMLLSVGFAGDDGLSNDEAALRRHHAQSLGKARLENTLSALREASKEMRDNVDHRLILELTLVRASAGQSAYTTPVAVPVSTPGLRPVASPNNGVLAWKAAKPAPVLEPASAPEVAQKEAEKEVEAITQTSGSFEDAVTVQTEIQAVELEEEALVKEATAPESVAEVPIDTEEAPPVKPEYVAAIVPEAAPGKKKGRRISNFDDLTELWPAVLMRVRKKIGVTAVAYLHDARPIGFTEEEIVLEFGKEFHHAKASEASGRLPFEQVISETLDRPRRLKLQLATPAPKVAPVVEEVIDDDDEEVDLESDANSTILDYTKEMFAADIVGRSG